MRIAFDITETCSREPTGCGQFTRRMVQAMLDENDRQGWDDSYSLHVRPSHRSMARHACCPPGMAVCSLPRFTSPWACGPEIIHGFATHAPRYGSALRVVTLFDVFSALDESAQWQRPRSRRRKISQYRRLARTCDLVIAISETTKRDFLSHFDYPHERVRVIPAGVGSEFCPEARHRNAAVRQRYRLPESYFLYVGAPVPRKNVPRLIDAYATSASRRRTGLVIAGSINAEVQQLMGKTRTMGLDRDVRFVGYVPDGDLPALYAAAEAFLFPTFYEGLGLPVLEAMACGVPVLIGDRGAAPEVAGGHATAVDPDDTHALSRAIDNLATVDAAARSLAVNHARSFSWEAAAAMTHRAYLRLLGAPPA